MEVVYTPPTVQGEKKPHLPKRGMWECNREKEKQGGRRKTTDLKRSQKAGTDPTCGLQ